jgi:hypothetical protein
MNIFMSLFTELIGFWDSEQVHEIIQLNIGGGVCLLTVSSKLDEIEGYSWISNNPIVSILEVTDELEISDNDCDHSLKEQTEKYC